MCVRICFPFIYQRVCVCVWHLVVEDRGVGQDFIQAERLLEADSVQRRCTEDRQGDRRRAGLSCWNIDERQERAASDCWRQDAAEKGVARLAEVEAKILNIGWGKNKDAGGCFDDAVAFPGERELSHHDVI